MKSPVRVPETVVTRGKFPSLLAMNGDICSQFQIDGRFLSGRFSIKVFNFPFPVYVRRYTEFSQKASWVNMVFILILWTGGQGSLETIRHNNWSSELLGTL